MLTLKVAGTESWDSRREEFVYTNPVTLTLEHSLVSISKWESKWGRSFLDDGPKTRAEELDYIRCMTVTQNVPPETYAALTAKDLAVIRQYMDAPMTATTIKSNKQGGRGSKKTRVTSEIVYYWMIELGIPFECQKWHFNRLMTLIRVCDIKSGPQKKMSKKDILRDNAALNKQRRAMMNTRG